MKFIMRLFVTVLAFMVGVVLLPVLPFGFAWIAWRQTGDDDELEVVDGE